MATVTPNFNWPVPTSTDLVKDGATAIEALGDSIDGSLVDLKGGTTGQVLSKTSGTDMDFTWVTTDDANAIQNSIVDAKGDLISATGNDTPARLAVGNNGETLVADSSTSTGLRYQVPVNVNPVLNSSMQVWQRGTSISVGAAASGYSADRWFITTGGSAAHTITRQATNDTTNLPFIQYCARVQRNSGQTGATQQSISQSFENINTAAYVGKTVTISFYARAGANFSPTSGTLNAVGYSGTGTDQNIALGYTGTAAFASTSSNLTTTWTRYTMTGTVATSATEMALYFYWTSTGTAGANDYLEITGVQLEVGSVATPFKTYAGTIQGELAACQRYYVRLTNGGASEGLGPVGSAFSTTAITGQFVPSVPMRVLPTVLEVVNCRLFDGVTVYAVTSATISGSQPGQVLLADFNVASGLTQYRYYRVIANSGTSYVGFGAEL